MVSLRMQRCVLALLALIGVLQTATAFAVHNMQTSRASSSQALMTKGSKRAKIKSAFRSVRDKLGLRKGEPKIYVETNFPVSNRKFQAARQQPKQPEEEDGLKDKYGTIDDVGERAYQILLDLGLVEKSGK
jgi:hypothetical protein